MKYRDESYQDTDHQFQEMRNLLVESYRLVQWPYNWSIARLEDWKYGGNSLCKKDNPDFFLDKARLWYDESGKLAGFCISEYGGNRIYIQVHPGYPKIESIMISWMVEMWSIGKTQVETYAYTADLVRQKLLSDFGFENPLEAGIMRKYDPGKPKAEVSVTPGFRIESLSRNKNYNSLVDAVNAAFGRSTKLTMDWLNSILSASGMNENQVLSALTTDGRHAAFCFACIDRSNMIAEIDPIGTHPEYQRRGLAKALVMECFQRLRQEGIRFAFIGSGPEPLPANRLYDSLDPVEKWNERKWIKRL